MQQDPEQVENFLGGADTAREYNHAVTTADERFQALFNVRHDDQFIDDRVWGFGANDAGFCNTDVATVLYPLLGVANGGTFHGPFHGTRATSGADAQGPEPQLMTDILAVLVFFMPDGVATPADHQVRLSSCLQHPGVAENVEYVIGQVFWIIPAKTGGCLRDRMRVDNVS